MNDIKVNTAHTPAPWTLRGPSKPTLDTPLGGDYAVLADVPINGGASATAQIIAETFARTDPAVFPDALANARLIAAAPELLEALKAAACSGCGMYYDEPFVVAPTSPCAHCQKQRAAIAKAEGKG